VDLYDVTAHYGQNQLAWACGENGTILRTLDASGAPGVGVESFGATDGGIPRLEVRPNPVRGRAVLRFALERAGFADVRLYDVRGAERAVLAREELAAGPQAVVWDARELPGGTYFVRVSTPTETFNGRVVRVR
jgi:hypothetical protein